MLSVPFDPIRRSLLIPAALIALAAVLDACPATAAEPAVTLAGAGRTGAPHRVEIVGLDAPALAAVQQAVDAGQTWQEIFTIRNASPLNCPPASPRPRPIWGECAIEGDRIVFWPRFPLRHGGRYLAEFTPPATAGPAATPMSVELRIPAPMASHPVQVFAVHPSADELPENLLKFYIAFRQPMARGEAYRHLALLNSDRQEVPDPFLELAEELWNPRGRRFTLLFDPGRIKRGVKPNQDMGAPLVAGRSYTLVVKAGWRAASGEPLAEDFEKAFRVVDADHERPQMDRWTISPPKADSHGVLRVDLDEPLDWAMLGHAIAVVDERGEPVAGDIGVGGPETRWILRPRSPWKKGAYRLVAAHTLEDLAGNSLGRAFEEPLEDATPKSSSRSTFERRFEIAP